MSRPNLVVILMDCVRASDFVGGRNGPAPSPGVAALRKESIEFPKAASVAPWTLPAHASLFTGLYPWEHGCSGKGDLRLRDSAPRVPEMLRAAGYRTISLSGNPIIGPDYNLVTGFQQAAWGEWWERAYRVLPTAPHGYEAASGIPQPSPNRYRTVGRWITVAGQRFPLTLATADGILRHLRTLDEEPSPSLNPWIEPTFRRWVHDTPADTPLFAFVNLIDAHEPYLASPTANGSVREWAREMRVPQDSLSLLSGHVDLGAEDMGRLHTLYQRSITTTMRRVEALIDILRAAHRWENTLFVLTSDHGQAFGENGMVWHGIRVDEAEMRIPLLLRLPGAEAAGTRATGWASPTDIAATVLPRAGISPVRSTGSESLETLLDSDRARPLLAIGDGASWNEPLWKLLSAERRAALDQVYGVAYHGDRKVVVNLTTGAVEAHRADPGSDHLDDLWDPSDAGMSGLAREARQSATALVQPHARDAGAQDLEGRLRSWGYL